jgi:pSer/pThr/pTyr-binding forkhead associated (FHA) protein
VALVPPPPTDTNLPSMPPPEKAATQAFVDGKPLVTTPPVPYSVEFQSSPRRPEDDTREIVTPKAVEYQQGAKQIEVSRLVLVKDGKEASFPLTKDSYTLGRHKNNDIVISDPKVSSFHARIDRTTTGFQLVDLKSRNGCYVNAKKIETQILKTGDEVRLGPAKLTYRVDYVAPVA